MGRKDNALAPNATGTDRIDTVPDESLRVWAKRLDASLAQVRLAEGNVGDRASHFGLHLKGSLSKTNCDLV